MAFEATKKEWCELYTFFRLLADGKVVLGTAEAKAGEAFWPVAMIQRERVSIISKKRQSVSKGKQVSNPCLVKISVLLPD